MSRRPVPSTLSTDRPDPRGPVRGRSARVAAVVLAAALDAACVLGFAAAGRSSHARDGGVLGVLGTAWPFLVAAAVGWLAVRAWRAPHRPWPTGVAVWAVAWLGGMALRAAAGDGTAPSFVVVAGLVLGALLVGWRVVATALSLAARRRRATGPAPGR
jgi:hypothetical protein